MPKVYINMCFTFKEFLQKCEEGTQHHPNWGGDRSTHRSQITRMIPKATRLKGISSPRLAMKKATKALFKF